MATLVELTVFAAVGSTPPLGRLGVGTWAWGNKLVWGYDARQDADLCEAFNAAVRGGVRFFDTGDSYGKNGRAETLLGEFRRTLPRSAPPVTIGTKLAVYPSRLTARSFVDACRASLDRLGLDKLAVAQAHWSAQKFQPWQEGPLWEGLADCYDLGLCEAVGVSNFGPKQLEKVARYMNRRNVPLVLNQVQMSLVSTLPLESGLLDLCRDLGITPIAYSPLGLGALSGQYSVEANVLPPGPRGFVVGQLLRGSRELVCTLEDIAAARRRTVAQVALNWVQRKGAVPIVGVRNAEMVRSNLGSLSFRLTAGEVEELDAAARKVRRQATQNIFQTD